MSYKRNKQRVDERIMGIELTLLRDIPPRKSFGMERNRPFKQSEKVRPWLTVEV